MNVRDVAVKFDAYRLSVFSGEWAHERSRLATAIFTKVEPFLTCSSGWMNQRDREALYPTEDPSSSIGCLTCSTAHRLIKSKKPGVKR